MPWKTMDAEEQKVRFVVAASRRVPRTSITHGHADFESTFFFSQVAEILNLDGHDGPTSGRFFELHVGSLVPTEGIEPSRPAKDSGLWRYRTSDRSRTRRVCPIPPRRPM